MDTMKIILARVIGALVFFCGGGALQIALWRAHNETYFDALRSHPYMWVLYLFVAALASEHSLKWMVHGLKR